MNRFLLLSTSTNGLTYIWCKLYYIPMSCIYSKYLESEIQLLLPVDLMAANPLVAHSFQYFSQMFNVIVCHFKSGCIEKFLIIHIKSIVYDI